MARNTAFHPGFVSLEALGTLERFSELGYRPTSGFEQAFARALHHRDKAGHVIALEFNLHSVASRPIETRTSLTFENSQQGGAGKSWGHPLPQCEHLRARGGSCPGDRRTLGLCRPGCEAWAGIN